MINNKIKSNQKHICKAPYVSDESEAHNNTGIAGSGTGFIGIYLITQQLQQQNKTNPANNYYDNSLDG